MKYTQPQVRDYGTLLELTADIDVHFTGAVSNLVVAALSAPLGDVAGREIITDIDGGGPGGGASEALAGGEPGGRKLPFTGLTVVLLAAAGAALAAAGSAIRSTMRRRP